MIQPTPGRIVWYTPNARDLHGSSEPPMVQLNNLPLAAMVVGIHTERCVNLDVVDSTGRHFARPYVQLLQGDGQDVPVSEGPFAQWMPYQKGKAGEAWKEVDKSLAPMQTADAQRAKVDAIARVCHEVNRGYCAALGDLSQPAWEDAPEWQRISARMGVDLHMMGDFGPEASHISWTNQKLEEGWKYGPVKDPEKKEHPCLVPFDSLPTNQQAKDFIFRAVVHALK